MYPGQITRLDSSLIQIKYEQIACMMFDHYITIPISQLSSLSPHQCHFSAISLYMPDIHDSLITLYSPTSSHIPPCILVESFPPFGLSDHNVLLLRPKDRPLTAPKKKFIWKRDMRETRIQELERYLRSLDWDMQPLAKQNNTCLKT